ncbi:DUF4333 domain-containing protein [Nocardia sp. NPDC052566]|uniref:DUF4333 domain-containing protein n=1 Tax=Nocardia sp. NPDC052566 TaxID=3364330 RepID=UPI0037C88ABF
MRLLATTVLAAIALAAAGCGSESAPTTAPVSKQQVETQITEKLAAKLGASPQAVHCPGDLDGKVGATLRCDLTDHTGIEYGVTVTTTAVDGKDVNFEIKVDDLPKAGSLIVVTKADVQEQVATELGGQVGKRPKSVTCPQDLAAKVGTTMRCTLRDDTDATYGLTVTVTSVEGSNVNFDVKVDSQPS